MKKILPLSLFVVLSLSACNTIDEDFERYETYSCYDIAREIGRWEARLEEAEIDGTIAVLDEVFGDSRRERDEAAVDGLFADIDAYTAEEYLNRLKHLEYRQQCRR